MNNSEPSNKALGVASDQHSRDIISIRDYFETILREYQNRTNERFEIQDKAVKTALEGQEKAVSAAILAADRAVTKAEIATEKRFEGVNEFRSQLADQAATLMPRAESEIRLKIISDKIEAIDRLVTASREQAIGSSKTIAYMVTALSILFGIIGIAIAVLK